MAEFTHLHLHTDYSLLDGVCEVERLMAHVKALGQRSAAMTDHGNIYGTVSFLEFDDQCAGKPGLLLDPLWLWY